MTQPVLTRFSGSVPAKGQGQVTFDANVDAFFPFISTKLYDDIEITLDYMTLGINAASALLTNNLPPLAGQGLKLLRVNSGENGTEYLAPPSGDLVGTTATQTLTDKTLTAPIINVGSDATGDLYTRSAGGEFIRVPLGTIGQVLRAGATAPEFANGWEYATAFDTTSGTGFAFNSIPAGVNDLELVLHAVSLSGDDDFLVQIGTAGGLVTSGYGGGAARTNGTAIGSEAASSGCLISVSADTRSISGKVIFARLEPGAHIWSYLAINANTGSQLYISAGSIDLGGELTRGFLTRLGASTFDAGRANWRWRT